VAQPKPSFAASAPPGAIHPHAATVASARRPHAATVAQRQQVPLHGDILPRRPTGDQLVPAQPRRRSNVAIQKADVAMEIDPSPGSVEAWSLANAERTREVQRMAAQEYPQLVRALSSDPSTPAVPSAVSGGEEKDQAFWGRSELDRLVLTDHTKAWGKDLSPTQQLAKCIHIWEQAAIRDPLELALCVYTTYFYSALNRSLRSYKKDLPFKSDLVRRLVQDTHNWLMAGFQATVPVWIRAFRMELQSEWMKDAAEGATLHFPGFTSVHRSLNGVSSMRHDIAAGHFGNVTNPALLVFDGEFPALVPHTKYFPNEREYVLPAGIRLVVTQKYTIHWQLTNQINSVTVYHIKAAAQMPTSSLLNWNVETLADTYSVTRTPPPARFKVYPTSGGWLDVE
jgi:hypothetical protein